MKNYDIVDGKLENYYDGDLDLSNTDILELPNNLTVYGTLKLNYTKIKKLPDNLTVKNGGLECKYSNLCKIGKNLKVDYYTSLIHTNVSEIPQDADVGGSLYLYRTPIKKLPDNLNLRDLSINGSTMTELPKNLTVRNIFMLDNTNIRTFPKDLNIKNRILTDDFKLRNGTIINGSYIYFNRQVVKFKSIENFGNYTLYKVYDNINELDKDFNNYGISKNLITDGKYFTYCYSVFDGIENLKFTKTIKEEIKYFKKLNLDSKITFDEAIKFLKLLSENFLFFDKHLMFLSDTKEIPKTFTFREMPKYFSHIICLEEIIDFLESEE